MISLSPETNLLAGAAGGVLIAISSTSLLYLTGAIRFEQLVAWQGTFLA